MTTMKLPNHMKSHRSSRMGKVLGNQDRYSDQRAAVAVRRVPWTPRDSQRAFFPSLTHRLSLQNICVSYVADC